MNQTRPGTQLHIGSLIFPRVDQIDFTGPFEVFSRIPNVSAGGVTAGIDGALRVAELLCGTQKAQEIQLDIQYAPDPPFNSGSVATAPPEVVGAVRAAYQPLTDARLTTARRIRAKLGLELSMPGNG